MTKNVSIQLLDSSYISKVNAFYNRIYKTNRTDNEFIWEFFEAPAGKAIYVIAVDTDTNEVIGIQSAIPIILRTHDKKNVLSAKSEDTLVDPEYRGLKIFERMYALLFEACAAHGIQYIWGFTNAKKPFMRLGFEIPFEHSQSLLMQRILPGYRYLVALNEQNSLTSKMKIAVLSVICKIRSSLKKKKNIQLNGMAVELTNDKKAVASVEIRDYLQDGFSIQQDADYVNWRLVNNPYHKLLFQVTFSVDGEVVGNCFFNHHKNDVWYLIDDIYAPSLPPKVRSNMLNYAINALQEKHRVALIRTWDFTHNQYGKDEIEVRSGMGFYHLDRGMGFVWKSLHDSATLSPKDFILSRFASQGVI